MWVTRLRLKNFRCFEDLDVSFDRHLTVLVGVNGSGKSSVIDAIAYFLETLSTKKSGRRAIQDDFADDIKFGAPSCKLTYTVEDLPPGSHEPEECSVSICSKAANGLMDFIAASESLVVALDEKDFSETGACWPILARYAADRYLKREPKAGRTAPASPPSEDQNTLKHEAREKGTAHDLPSAYQDAFSPQIDFPSSVSWFVDRHNELARLRQRHRQKRLAALGVPPKGVPPKDDLELVDEEAKGITLPDLAAVQKAVSQALSGLEDDDDAPGETGTIGVAYDEPYVEEETSRFVICRHDQPTAPYTVAQLSDGYRTMLAMVMDLARRMAVANSEHEWPKGQTVLDSPGIVLIDEVELHLHPSWQQVVLPTLTRIFPAIQFIVSTHSPQVLTTIEPKHIRVLDGNSAATVEESTYGADASSLLEGVLNVSRRPIHSKPIKVLESYRRRIENGDYESDEAKAERELLDGWLYGDKALVRADWEIDRAKRRKAQEVNFRRDTHAQD